MMDDLRPNVTIVGAGMAGLIAGYEAVTKGAEVVIVEKGSQPGGSMAISGGHIWTFPNMDALNRHASKGNAALQQTVVDNFDTDIRWLEREGFHLEAPISEVPRGRRIDPPRFTETLVRKIETAGGTIANDTPMVELQTDDNGAVASVVVEESKTARRNLESDAVVVATGGFQGNEFLVEQFIADPHDLWLRSNPTNTGDGLLESMAIGGKATKGMGHFYGHNLPAPPAKFSTDTFQSVTQYYGSQAVALDQNGERFADESASRLDAGLAQATAKEANGRAYYVVDGELYSSAVETGRSVAPYIEGATEVGGRVTKEDSLAALGDALTEWGVNGHTAVQTIREYNDAITRGRPETLNPPRTDHRHAIDRPPFVAVEVQPGITFTTGGLDVTDAMEVYARNGTVSTLMQFPANPRELPFTTIDGLYAAGMDVGNVNGDGYIGGLAISLVTGRIAGRNAAAHAMGT